MPTQTKSENFKYVLIPADSSQPIEEQSFPQVDLENDLFIKMIKASFAQGNPESRVNREQLIQQMSEHAKRDITESVDAKTLEHLLSTTSVDILTIAVPSVENNHLGISLYCDDKGKSKSLLINSRACGLVSACGLVGQELRGDVFLSRVFDDGDENWFRVDFGMVDVSSGAPWVKRAAEQASRKMTSGPTSLSGLAEQFLSKSGISQSPAILSGRTEPEHAVTGGTDKYRWYQTNEEIEVTIPVSEKTGKADISVDVRQKSLKVKVGDSLLIDGELFESVDSGDSTWTFSAKDSLLQLTLLKKIEGKMWADLLSK